MASKLKASLGQAAFWLSWPLLYLYLGRSRRTRVLVTYHDKVLVCKHVLGEGKWSLPGGGIKRGEPGIDSVIRELQEETGILLEARQLKQLFTDTFQQNGLRFQYDCFQADLPMMLAIAKRPAEILEAQWMRRDQLNASNARNDVLKALSLWPTRKSPLQ